MEKQGSGIKGSLHCHDRHSNGMDSDRLPLESPTSPLEQLDMAFKKGLDFIFITNHNTTKSYKKYLECQRSHPRLRKVRVYQGEEISALLSNGNYGHILGWGLSEEIRRGLTVEETLDGIRSQGAVSCAAHPYGFMDYLRDEARLCDLIEVFNPNNIDVYSNIRAYESARRWKKFGMAGSDSHMPKDIDKCIVGVHAGNDLDGILHALRRGRFCIEKASYSTRDDIIGYFRYQLSDAEGLIADISRRYGRTAGNAVRFLIDRSRGNGQGFWTGPLADFLLSRARNISMKLNIYGYGESLVDMYGKGYSLEYSRFKRLLMESFMPPEKSRSGHAVRMSMLRFSGPKEAINALNRMTSRCKRPS